MGDSRGRRADAGEAETGPLGRSAKRIEPARVAAHPEWCRLARAIRRQVEACVELDASDPLSRQLADRAEGLARELERHASGKRIGLVDPDHVGGAVMHTLPFSPIMGRLNPASYGIEIRTDGERVFCEARLGEVVEGATGLVHGGVIAAIYDELLAAANMCRGTGGPTGRLSIRYRKPTPLHESLEFEAWIDRVDGRKLFTRGQCRARGEVVSEAEALFIAFSPDRRGTEWHLNEDAERSS